MILITATTGSQQNTDRRHTDSQPTSHMARQTDKQSKYHFENLFVIISYWVNKKYILNSEKVDKFIVLGRNRNIVNYSMFP